MLAPLCFAVWLQRLCEEVEAALGGLARDRQGREEHEDVFFGGDEQAVLAAGVAHLGSVVLVCSFDADGEAFAAGWPCL